MRDQNILADLPLDKWTDEELVKEYGERFSLSGLPDDIARRVERNALKRTGETRLEDMEDGKQKALLEELLRESIADQREL